MAAIVSGPGGMVNVGNEVEVKNDVGAALRVDVVAGGGGGGTVDVTDRAVRLLGLIQNTDFDIRSLSLSEDNVRQTTRPMTAFAASRTGPLTSDILVLVGPAQRLRLLRNAGHCDPALSQGTFPVITLKVGTTTIYTDKLEPGLPWAETVCFEGALGDDLTIDVDIVATVFLNMRFEFFS